MTVPRPANALGIATVILGCWLIWIASAHPLIQAVTDKDSSNDIVAFVLLPLLALPGLFAIHSGIKLTREKEPKYIKRAVGWFAVVATFSIFSLQRIVSAPLNDKLARALFMFLATLAVIPPYLILVAFFMKKEGLPTGRLPSLIGNGIVLILTFQICILVSRIIEAYSPIKTHDAWEISGLIIPFVAAWLFYGFAVRVLSRYSTEWLAPKGDFAKRSSHSHKG